MHLGGAELGVDSGRDITERAVRPDGVVVVRPCREYLPCVRQRGEERLVQKLVPKPAVEALDEGVLRRFARRGVVPLDDLFLRPHQDRHAGELGPVITDNRVRLAAPGDNDAQLDRKSTRLNSSHVKRSRMPSSA